MTEPITVLLADDHTMVRLGLKAYFSTLSDIQVIGEASTGEEAVRLVAQHTPDVVLMDLLMPVMDGITALGTNITLMGLVGVGVGWLVLRGLQAVLPRRTSLVAPISAACTVS